MLMRFRTRTQRRQSQPEGISLLVEAALEILDASYTPLGIGNHFRKEVGEGGAADFCGASAVDVPVVDGLPIGGNAETALGLLLGFEAGGLGRSWGGGC